MKVCFWGSLAGALTGNTDGGGELQIALLAKTLVKAGHDIVVIDPQAADNFITDEGIQVIKIAGWNSGIPFIRTFTHRIPRLYTTLKKQKANIYYCRIRDFRHIIAYWAARKVGAKFVLGLASDLDVSDIKTRWKYYYSSNLKNLIGFFDGLFSEIVYPYLLRRSDSVFVQHSGQLETLKRKNINSIVLANLFDSSKISVISNPEKKDFIYVGWLDERKGFTEFFELVKRAPQHSFKVVGPPRGKVGHIYYEKLKLEPNVTLLGRLSHSETIFHIANSKALICTSPMEGFPNIFIEAWACATPVISLYVDPGGILKEEKLGEITHGDMNKLIEALDNEHTSNAYVEKAKIYLENNHTINDDKILEVSNVFDNVNRTER